MADDVSFAPSTAQEGGGLLQAVNDATLTFECTTFDYGGSVAVPVPALHVHGEYEDENGGAAEFDEYYSAGDASRLRPKKDGTGFQALVEGAGLTKTCKAMQFIASLVSANGGDEDIVSSGNIKDLDGINCNLERKPDIDRPGLSSANSKGRARTIMLVTEINSLPGQGKAKGKAKPGGKPAPAGKPASGGKPALRAKTVEAIEALLESNGDIEATDLPQLLFRAHKKDPDVKAMTELAADENFLSAKDTPWGFDGETLSAA